ERVGLLGCERAGVDLAGEFGAGGHVHALAQHVSQAQQLSSAESRRRAAAHEDGRGRKPLRALQAQFVLKRVYVPVNIRFRRDAAVEVAVLALTDAEGDVDVQRTHAASIVSTRAFVAGLPPPQTTRTFRA